MAGSKTASFVTELPVLVDSKQDAELLSGFQAGRQLYNACLKEAMVRMNLVGHSESCGAAKNIPIEQKKKRSEAFTAARQTYRYRECELYAYATIVSTQFQWIGEKLDFNTQQIVNEILRYGKHIKRKNVTIKACQKRYGKAIWLQSPGCVQSELKRKAESAGGSLIKFSTQKIALSQTHLKGERIKKKRSQRVHYEGTGAVRQRDLFRAYLRRYVNEEDKLSLSDAVNQYPRMEPTLLGAWERFKQSANRVGVSESGLSHSSLERIPSNFEKISQISQEGLKANCKGSKESPPF